MRDLTKNTVVFGECTKTEQAAFRAVGRSGCEYRDNIRWESCKQGLQDGFANDTAYRIKALIYRTFEERLDVWCVNTDHGLIVYDTCHAVIKLNGVKVEFLGYQYDIDAIRSDIFKIENGKYILPSRGVWRVAT